MGSPRQVYWPSLCVCWCSKSFELVFKASFAPRREPVLDWRTVLNRAVCATLIKNKGSMHLAPNWQEVSKLFTETGSSFTTIL